MNTHPPRHWLFIVNPVAGGGKAAKLWPKMAEKLMSEGISFEAIFTKEKGHAIQLAQAAVENGHRHLAAVGGDGTAHEVANGIMRQTACPSENVTFTLLPIGTGNDWIKEHRIPKSFTKWLHFFKTAATDQQDVGWLTCQRDSHLHHRFFINVAGLAYDGFVVKKAETQRVNLSNRLVYLLLIFRCLFQFTLPKAKIVFDGQVAEDFYYTINVGICRYSGGGMQLVPHARPNDGKLALTLARRISKLEVLFVTPLFYLGKIGLHPAVWMSQTEKIMVQGLDNQPVLIEADGEFLGEAPVEIGILPKALTILKG